MTDTAGSARNLMTRNCLSDSYSLAAEKACGYMAARKPDGLCENEISVK